MKKIIRTILKNYEGLEDSYLFKKNIPNYHPSNRKYRKIKEAYGAFTKTHKQDEDFLEKFSEFLDRMYPIGCKNDEELHFMADFLYESLFECLYAERNQNNKEEVLLFVLRIFQKLEQFSFEKLYMRHSIVYKILVRRNVFAFNISDEESKYAIIERVYAFAKRHKLSQIEAARLINSTEEQKINRKFRRKFGVLLMVFPLILLSFTWKICGFFECFLLAFPVFLFSYQIITLLASRTVPPHTILKLKDPIQNKRVLVTVTTILGSQKDAIHYAQKLETLYFQNREGTNAFAILADLKDARTERMYKDASILETATEQVQRLNQKYGEHFYLLVRKRQKSCTEDCYMGWERKRGALIELVRLIKQKSTSFDTIVGSKTDLYKTDFILTLDSDTNLRMGSVDIFLRTACHPENKPVIRNKVVIEGYGVLQPRFSSTIQGGNSTFFRRMQDGSGGIDSYQKAVFDFYESIFHKSAYTGKGMFHVDVFSKVIDGAFPDGKILSHDLLEGTRLRCGYISELILTCKEPSSALSFFKREHRWIRGDFQTLPFLFRYEPFTKKKIKNPIDRFSKFMMVMNYIRALVPVFTFSSLLFSSFLNEADCTFFLSLSFSYLIFPLCTEMISGVRFAKRNYYSKVLEKIFQSFFTCLYHLMGIAYRCYLSLDAFVRVLWRSLFSNKHLLEWVTAAEQEQQLDAQSKIRLFFIYQKKMLFSILSGLLFLIFMNAGILRLFGIGFLLFPAVSFFISLSSERKSKLSEKEVKQVYSYMEKSFLYFQTFVNEKSNFLPPDNYQEYPLKKVAMRTSPTNIGLYLTSLLAMRDFGAIEEDVFLDHLEKTVHSMEKLPKYKGHFYNWYQIEKQELLGPPVISTVDSGNLAIALIAVINGLKEHETDLKERLTQMLHKMDFSFLYNKTRKLLCITFDTASESQSPGCYDLHFSEAKSAYYFAISRNQIPVESYFRLEKPLISKEGYVGMLSYSGTAFEYFMPHLFLPLFENSLDYEALSFAFYEEKQNKTAPVFGRSEACYFSFDDDMNYQYKAFGNGNLALDRKIRKENVVAPYASFLYFKIHYKEALSNLKKLEKMGAMGEFGFYDSVDFTKERVGEGHAIIKTYMAHHVGMSIVAIANLLRNDLFERRLMEEQEAASAVELLTIRVPLSEKIERYSKKQKTMDFQSKKEEFSEIGKNANRLLPFYHSIANEHSVIVANSIGNVSFQYKDWILTSILKGRITTFDTISLYYSSNHKKIRLLNPLGNFIKKEQELIFENRNENLTSEVRFSVPEDGLYKVTLHLERKNTEEGVCSLFLPVLLSRPEDSIRHPFYPGLFTEGITDFENHLIYFKQRKKKSTESDLYFAFGCSSLSDTMVSMSYDDLKWDQNQDLDFNFQSQTLNGDLRKPYLHLNMELPHERTSKFTFFFSFGLSKSEAAEKIKRAESEPIRETFAALSETESKEVQLLESMFLLGIYQKQKIKNFTSDAPIEELFRYSISSDVPIFTFFVPTKEMSAYEKGILYRLILAQKLLLNRNLIFDLVFLFDNRDFYFKNQAEEYKNVFSHTKHLLFLSDTEAKRVLEAASRVCISLDENLNYSSLYKKFSDFFEMEEPLAFENHIFKGALKGLTNTPYGSFFEDRFTFKKGQNRTTFSYIYATKNFGTVVTSDSCGYTWFQNASECRLTPFFSNEKTEYPSEALILQYKGISYDLLKSAELISFTKGYALYYGNISSLYFEIKIGISSKYPVKIIEYSVLNGNEEEENFKIKYQVAPILSNTDDGNVGETKDEDTLFYKRTLHKKAENLIVYLHQKKREYRLSGNEKIKGIVLLGCFHQKNDRLYYQVLKELDHIENCEKAFDLYGNRLKNTASAFMLESDNPNLDTLFNYYLVNQICSSRINGRTGYEQPGGAYGFRDQLQDAASMIYHDSNFLKNQILRCACHQYEEGDVQHWWHSSSKRRGFGDYGLRSHCSDDLLWLPLFTARYLDATEDTDLLLVDLPYLKSEPLTTEEDRYEQPFVSYKESLYKHCIKCIDRVLLNRSIETGLCAMGSCDWNDGYSEVFGESVFTTELLILTIKNFMPYFKKEEQASYKAIQKELEKLLDQYCFENDRYVRCFFKDGYVLGSENSKECKIDILPQAFAAFIEQNDKSKTAVMTAYRTLYEKDERMLLLFQPPFENETHFPGYVMGYLKGYRENGGQYNHAAVWCALALYKIGAYEPGYHLLCQINPIEQSIYREDVYLKEPYALTGDVYFSDHHKGRGGWSHYTGSAGWYLYTVLTELLGYEEKNGYFLIHPKLSASFQGFHLKINKYDTIYDLYCSIGDKNKILLDGKAHENHFLFDNKRHILKIVLQNL